MNKDLIDLLRKNSEEADIMMLGNGQADFPAESSNIHESRNPVSRVDVSDLPDDDDDMGAPFFFQEASQNLEDGFYYDNDGIIRMNQDKADKKTDDAEPKKEFFDYTQISEEKQRHGRIEKYFSKGLIKFLYGLATSYEYTDNNEKAKIIATVLGEEFEELGTGTNRIAFVRGPFVYKIALDRRGLIDNFSEFKRSVDAPQYLAKSYETNGVITTAEYITTIEPTKFSEYRELILAVLHELSKQYIFGDIGYDAKNYCNIGYRDNGALVMADYAYMHPMVGNEEALKCICGEPLRYNRTYTMFECPRCNQTWDYIDIKRKLDADIENLENQTLNGFKNLDSIENPIMEKVLDDAVAQIVTAANAKIEESDDD